jgi:uncharacterized delta-60 repeat protein
MTPLVRPCCVPLAVFLLGLSVGCGGDGDAPGDGGPWGDASPDAGEGGPRVRPNAILLQDGKLLVAGQFSGDFYVGRFSLDGSPDPTFGDGGHITLDFGGPSDGFLPRNEDSAFALALASDGILVGGYARGYIAGGEASFGIAKLSFDGALDSSFGNEGLVVSDWTVTSVVQNLHVDAEGRIYAVGNIVNGAPAYNDVAIVRYLADGTVDASFSRTGTGAGAVWHGGGEEYGNASALTADGVLAGGGVGFPLARFELGGPLDGTFGTGGVFEGAAGDFFALRVLGDGSYLLAGITGADSSSRDVMKLLRVGTDGMLDETFGTGGLLEVQFDLTIWELPGGDSYDGGFLSIRGMAVQPDGKVLLYTSLLGFFNNYPAVVRIDPAVGIDTGFGDGGLHMFQASLPLLSDLRRPQASSQALLHDGQFYVTDVRVDISHTGPWITSLGL